MGYSEKESTMRHSENQEGLPSKVKQLSARLRQIPVLAGTVLTAMALTLVSCKEETAYVFSYFDTIHEAAGLCLAYSYDGYHWRALNGNQPILSPNVGKDKLMRDPSINQAPDGTFHMVWTTSWHQDLIGYASSPDLINWSEQKAIPVMKDYQNVQNCWAPELFYCKEERCYYILWASTVSDSEENVRAGREDPTRLDCNKIYCTTTTDFETFTPTRLYFDKPYAIDAAVVQDPVTDEYVMVVKDDPAGVDMHATRTKSMAEGFPTEMVSAIQDDENKEGPSPIFLNDTDLLVFYDRYMLHKYGAVLSRDHGDTWENVTEQIRMPEGMSHGTALKVNRKVVKKLIKAYGEE